MRKTFFKIQLYTIIFSTIIAVFIPLKALAINIGFYSANDILFYNPDDTCGATDGAGGTSASGPIFDLAKLAIYEKNTGEPSGDKNDSGTKDIWAQGKWAQTQDAKDRAISLGVNETEMVNNKTRDEVIAMIAAEVARQYNTLSDKHGTTLAQAQQAILFYQQFEDNRFRLFNDSGWPSYTFDNSGAALNILSLTNDKFAGGNGKNKRAAASYDIKYAIYLGVQEHMQRFRDDAKGVGEERWRFTLGVVFWPSNRSLATLQEMMYWKRDDVKANPSAWSEWATLVSGLGGGSGGGSGTTATMPYELPATSGKTGFEEAIDENGALVSDVNKKVTFSALASKGQAYRDYYITMRWNYTSWNWDGTHSGLDSAQNDWMAKEPRIVLVTNPKTGKSIYAAALEAGPAPWTGVDRDKNNNPKQGWVNPQKGTPAEYKGRVSGFPPIAIDALGATMGMSDGSGDILTYQWATDQSVTPGPTDASATSGGSATDCSSSSTSSSTSPVAGEFGWDLTGTHAMVFYDQSADEWRNQPFGHGKLGACGCGPTSLAMIVATLTGDKSVNPANMAAFYAANGGQVSDGCGSAWNWGVVATKYDVSVTDLGFDLDKAKEVLKRGGLVLFSWSGAPFTGGGHIMVMRKFSPDGKIYIASSGGSTNLAQSQQAWDESIFINGYHGPAVGSRGSTGSLKGMWGFEKK